MDMGLINIIVRGSSYKGHRLSWIIHNNKLIPQNLEICHTCDNPACVNPNHLFLGTHQDNMQDALKKGRLYLDFHLKGEENPKSKLTWKKVHEIRERYKSRDVLADDLAEEYGVNREEILRVVRNELWIDENYKYSNAGKSKNHPAKRFAKIKELKELIKEGFSSRKLARILETSQPTILEILLKEINNE